MTGGGTGDTMRGEGREAVRRAKGAVGDATARERLQGEGRIDQAQDTGQRAKGGVEDTLDDLGDKVGDTDSVRAKVAGTIDRATHAEERGAGHMGSGTGTMRVKAEDLDDNRPNRNRSESIVSPALGRRDHRERDSSEGTSGEYEWRDG